MKRICNQVEMQTIDKITIEEVGIPSAVLMERAAYSVFEEIELLATKSEKILVLAGTGNNGGDGVALARILLEAGYQVCLAVIGTGKESLGFQQQMVIFQKEQKLDDVSYMLKIAYDEDVKKLDNQQFSLIVDSIFGIGLTREVKGIYETVIRYGNQINAKKVAVDIPSGLETTTGNVLGDCFQADVTVTFGFLKQGMLLGDGPRYCGDIKVKQVGFAKTAIATVNPKAYTLEEIDLEDIPKRDVLSNKGSYGKVVVFAGSKNMAGAAHFVCGAAYRMGVGLVKLYTHKDNIPVVSVQLPELLTAELPENVDKMNIRERIAEANSFGNVIVIGSGLGQSEEAKLLVEFALRDAKVPIVLDADGLNIVSEHMEWLKETKVPVIVTPHVKEMERLTGRAVAEIKADKIGIAKEFVGIYGCICVLKDARTVVTGNGDDIFINQIGNNGMSTGGTGDVLAGVIGALVASGMDGRKAADYGVLIHGMAGNLARDILGERSMLASDLLEQIPSITKDIC